MSGIVDTKLGDMSFDSSLHNSIDAQLTTTEFKERLETLLQPILDQRFAGEYQKTKIAPHIDRISFKLSYIRGSPSL